MLIDARTNSADPQDERITYIVDRTLVRFLKISAGLVAIMLGIAAFAFGLDFSRGRVAITEMVDMIKPKLDTVEEFQTKIEGHASTVEEHAKMVEQRLQETREHSSEMRRLEERLKDRLRSVDAHLATIEDVLATVERRSREQTRGDESLADRVQGQIFSQQRGAIITTLLGPGGHASGFFVSAQGHILTADYSVPEADSVRIRTSEGIEFVADVLAKDGESGFALLVVRPQSYKSPTGVTEPQPSISFLKLSEDPPVVGDQLVAIGTSVQKTITSAAGRADQITDEWLFAVFNEPVAGFGGGPVLDKDGKVVAMIYASVAGREAVDRCKQVDLMKKFLRRHGVFE